MIIYELESDYAHYLEALGAPQTPRAPVRVPRTRCCRRSRGLALQLGAVIAGALVTEIVFSLPGARATQIYRAITNEDYFVIRASSSSSSSAS